MKSDELIVECANCGNFISELETIEDTTWRGEKIKVCKNCYLSNKCSYDEEYILEAEMDDLRLERLENENKNSNKEES